MANGDYRLIRENSNGTLDEKIVTAQAGKVLGFDENLNPKMESLPEGDVPNISWGIANPSGGNDGDIYFQYE